MPDNVIINLTDTIPPKNIATIDKDGLIGNSYSKEQYLQIVEAANSEERGIITPTMPVPSGGWQKGWYKPSESSDSPGTNYPNAGDLKAIKGFINKFYFDGSIWNAVREYVEAVNVIDPSSITLEPNYYNNSIAGNVEIATGIIRRQSKHSKKILSYIETQLNHNGDLMSDLDVTGDGFYIKENGKYYVQIFDAVIDVRDIGMMPGQNCGATFQRHLNRLQKTGAAFYFPPSEEPYIFEVQIILPFKITGQSPDKLTPAQRPFTIIGSGPYTNGKAFKTEISPGVFIDNGFKGSTIKLAHQGNGTYLDSKIITYGLGKLAIRDITLQDESNDSTPFIYTTFTTLLVENTAFIGSKRGILCDQDVFYLGGRDQTEMGHNVNGGFQGYGTIIRGNYFLGIRHGMVAQNYCNGIIFSNNTFWVGCGNANGGAIFIDGSYSDQACTGNIISENLVEMQSYKHFFVGIKAYVNVLSHNNPYDAQDFTESYYHFVDSKYNKIDVAFHNDAHNGNLIPLITGDQEQTVINSHQNQFSRIEKLNVSDLVVANDSSILQSAKMKDTSSNLMFFNRYFKSNKEYVTVRQNADGSETDFLMIKDYGGGYFMYNLKGIEARIVADQKMKFWCGVGSEIYIGDNSGTKGITMYNGGMRFYPQHPDEVITNSVFLNSLTGKLSFKDSTEAINILY